MDTKSQYIPRDFSKGGLAYSKEMMVDFFSPKIDLSDLPTHDDMVEDYMGFISVNMEEIFSFSQVTGEQLDDGDDVVIDAAHRGTHSASPLVTNYSTNYSTDPTLLSGQLSLLGGDDDPESSVWSGGMQFPHKVDFFDRAAAVSERGEQRFSAPFFPAVHLSTFFLVQPTMNVDEVVDRISSFFAQETKNISCQFVPSECAWYCALVTPSIFCRFAVRVYRFPNKSEHHRGCHAVELQRFEGDSWTFQSVYNDIRGWLLELPAVPADALLPIFPFDSSGAIGGSSREDVKMCVVDLLRGGSSSAVLEATQLAGSVFSDASVFSPVPTTSDESCVASLVSLFDPCLSSVTCPASVFQQHVGLESMGTRLVSEPEAVFCDAKVRSVLSEVLVDDVNSRGIGIEDWAVQHAVMALAGVARGGTNYRKLIMKQKHIGNLLRFLLCCNGSGTYDTEAMRRASVLLLETLIRDSEATDERDRGQGVGERCAEQIIGAALLGERAGREFVQTVLSSRR